MNTSYNHQVGEKQSTARSWSVVVNEAERYAVSVVEIAEVVVEGAEDWAQETFTWDTQ